MGLQLWLMTSRHTDPALQAPGTAKLLRSVNHYALLREPELHTHWKVMLTSSLRGWTTHAVNTTPKDAPKSSGAIGSMLRQNCLSDEFRRLSRQSNDVIRIMPCNTSAVRPAQCKGTESCMRAASDIYNFSLGGPQPLDLGMSQPET